MGGVRLLGRIGLLSRVRLGVLLGGNFGLDLAEFGLSSAGRIVDDAGADEEGEVHDDQDPERKQKVSPGPCHSRPKKPRRFRDAMRFTYQAIAPRPAQPPRAPPSALYPSKDIQADASLADQAQAVSQKMTVRM